MDKKHKRVIAAGIILAGAAAAAAGVYAYLQSTAEQPNTFSINENSVSISESFSEPENMFMDNTFTKIVSVTNEGTSEQFVRVYLDFSDSRVRNKSKIVYEKSGTKEGTWDEFLADLPESWEYVPESDTDGAILGGYFYYTEILPKGGSTAPLITGVKTTFGTDTNTDRITDFDIVVYTESVQTVETGTGREYAADEWREAWKSFLGD